MTTTLCHRPVPLPVLDAPPTPSPNPLAPITGPRHISAVQMLRISVTDICNLRCVYCMPDEGVEWLPKSSLLTFEEITAIAKAAAAAGVTHLKLTGGEPTTRRDLPVLVHMLKKIPGIQDLSLTTNGILLLPLLEKLRDAGLNRLTISLDSLRPERFADITRGGDFHRVWAALEKALALNFDRIKINVVVMRNMNLDEVADFAALTQKLPITVRFIEFMPLGRSQLTDNPTSQLVPESELKSIIEQTHGPLTPLDRAKESGVGPAQIFALSPTTNHDSAPPGRLGFISAMSHPFCETCNRLRLTPDGLLRSCLFDGGEVDLKPILRPPLYPAPLTPEGNLADAHAQLIAALTTCVAMKPQTHSHHGNKAMNRIGG